MKTFSTLLLCLLAVPFAEAQVQLPVTFEGDPASYELADFGGATSMIVADPADASNTVVETVRGAGAVLFAGTVVASQSGFASRIPFTADATTMSLRVWTPEAGTPVRLKVENAANGGISAESQVLSTMSGMWETLVFDLSDVVEGPAFDPNADYGKAVVFFDFGLEGAPEPSTFYWDDLAFGGDIIGGGGEITLPITFEDEDIDYELTDFGGNASVLVADPTDASNTVVQSTRTAGAECFAGTTVGEVTGFDERVPFAPGQTEMSVRVWSPEAGIRVLFKVEEVGNPGLNVETLAVTTTAGAWETMVFDFGDPMPNLNPIQFGANYNKASIFFDFSCDVPPPPPSPERVYYWDDVTFGGAGTGPEGLEFPITFEEEIDYGLVDFGGTASMLITDPTDAMNTVVETVRGAGAVIFAGTVVGDGVGFADPVPFTATATTMSLRVWTPEAGTPVRLKMETSSGQGVETEELSAMAGMWETLVFDFTNEVAGTMALDLNASYTKGVVFFDFGLENAPEPSTFYWDDLVFGAPTDAEGGADAQTLALSQNAPNPFSGTSTIRFALPHADRVVLHVYNVLGQRVATLADGLLAEGEHTVSLDAGSLASGMYLYRLQTGSGTLTRSMTITH